ncbi:organic solute transporter Ostalpha-domain-containing protein [Cokeromyces recurvatus]|uniref:organic solute transporter Ostalpha-domain-containing protein n=1 Tax=Cokeromyces recurvatus TaxID=90255 RepID=UPI0022207D3B|nr:organic solute transporter Ostalpha-domain-containing protein [Cokeromyces recurvatus]KAI7900464.1 organic solute transporter Ostalpha-domain-containing protein [Cokeromyces recurvatus]
MSSPEVSKNSSCPTEPGLSTSGGFDPGLDWAYVREYPKDNWHVIGWMACLALLFITWIVSITTVTKHLKNYYEPQLQRHKLRVLLFPPVYATLAWFSYLRYDYATTIMFFATVFEAFAVYNLYFSLQAYLKPYRIEAGNLKEAKDIKIMFIIKRHLNSMWGMHYRIITDILVLQYPIWSLIDSFISIFAELRGRYCDGSYSFKGAYVYLTIINFYSLSIILTALFTYLDVFSREWKRGRIPAHGMFWCVKGPIMIIFYIGDVLLTILTTCNVIKGTDGTHGSIAWPADAVKNGLYVIVICVVMFFDSFLMLRFFGPKDNIANAVKMGQTKKMSYFRAFIDAYIAYIPEFLLNVLCCGADSFRLMRKRKALKKKREQQLEHQQFSDPNNFNNNLTEHLLDNPMSVQNEDPNYKMEAVNIPQHTSSATMIYNSNNNNNNNHSTIPSSIPSSTDLYRPLQPESGIQMDIYPQPGYMSSKP